MASHSFPIDLEGALKVAVEAAKLAGALMHSSYKERYSDSAAAESLEIETKTSDTDLVTKYDKMCDTRIRAMLSKYNEESCGGCCRFITEESSPDDELTDNPTWIVDPIDGTTAFVHKSFDCCVSIGLAINKEPVLAVVYCPFVGSSGNMGEMYTAIKGHGAFCNGQRLQVSSAVAPTEAIVNFNFPSNQAALDDTVSIRHEMVELPINGIRGYGATVMILAQIAAGRIDLFMDGAGKIWDVCAGVLLVTEAGGVVLSLEGNPFTLTDSAITAACSAELAQFGSALCAKYNYARHFRKV